MTALQARVRRFIADQPAGTTTNREVYERFGTLRRRNVHAAVLALANDGHIVLSEAARLSLPHAFIDGRPVIGVEL